MLEKRLQGQKKGGSWRWSELPEPRFLLAGLSGWCCYCSTAGVRTNEIRRLTEWWHARTLASYYKSGWSNELIFFLPLKYYKFLSFDSTYLFIFFINLHALYLIMKKKVCRLFFLSLCVLGQIFWMECGNYDLSWPLVLNNVQVAGNP